MPPFRASSCLFVPFCGHLIRYPVSGIRIWHLGWGLSAPYRSTTSRCSGSAPRIVRAMRRNRSFASVRWMVTLP